MSRVFEALRRSELETGIPSTVLDPDTFFPGSAPKKPRVDQQTGPSVDQPIGDIAWDEVRTLYNLKLNPFEPSPDPAFLFPTRRYNEALAALHYGVRRRKGVVVLTGEVGTGKTLLLRCLLQLLEQSNTDYAYAFNGRISPVEFLGYVAGDLGLTPTKSKNELLLQLSSHLGARYQKKLTTVLVIDEAHDFSSEVLEEILLLTNLETTQGKLLQILLVGQPELDEKLDSHDLRALKQRIAVRSRLEPFDKDETKGYIQRRLQVAGANSHEASLFPIGTIARVYEHSRGIPRLINTLCENALINPYAWKARSVTPEIIDQVAANFRLGPASPPQPEPAAE